MCDAEGLLSRLGKRFAEQPRTPHIDGRHRSALQRNCDRGHPEIGRYLARYLAAVENPAVRHIPDGQATSKKTEQRALERLLYRCQGLACAKPPPWPSHGAWKNSLRSKSSLRRRMQHEKRSNPTLLQACALRGQSPLRDLEAWRLLSVHCKPTSLTHRASLLQDP